MPGDRGPAVVDYVPSTRPPQDALRPWLRELAAVRVSYGYRRLDTVRRREGWAVSPKRIYRLYCGEELHLRGRSARPRGSRRRLRAVPFRGGGGAYHLKSTVITVETLQLPTPEEVTNFGIEITPQLLAALRSELLTVFDFAHLDAAHKKRVKVAGTREYAWVNRPEIPLLLQAYRDYESWIAALQRLDPPSNLGALGPFVRLGLAVQFARRLVGGPERIQELRRLALASDFAQLTNKAFELEVASYFGQATGRQDIAFGALGGKPDLWLAPEHPLAVPVECKVVTGGKHPSKQCRGAWGRFIVWTVKQMERLNVAAGICVRARDDFGPDASPALQQLTVSLLNELAAAPNETWGLRSDEGGAFLVYGYRLCKWGEPRPPFAVPLGLDGDLAVWVQHDTHTNEVRKPYFFALKFQSPEVKAEAVLDSFKTAAGQLKQTRPDGPGVAVLKVGSLRKGDLFEIDEALRRALASRDHVSAVLLLWDEGAVVPDPGAGEAHQIYGFTLKPYLLVNQTARVASGWPDSRQEYFPEPPKSLLRSATGELVPFDFEEEQRLLRAGTLLTETQRGKIPVLLDARNGRPIPSFPHVVPESSDLSESNGAVTFLFRFRDSLAKSLLAVQAEEVLLEWFALGTSHFRIYRDRHLNFRINRRMSLHQDNVAIDLVPFSESDTLHLQLTWTPDGLSAALRWSDRYPAAFCKAARSPLD